MTIEETAIVAPGEVVIIEKQAIEWQVSPQFSYIINRQTGEGWWERDGVRMDPQPDFGSDDDAD